MRPVAVLAALAAACASVAHGADERLGARLHARADADAGEHATVTATVEPTVRDPTSTAGWDESKWASVVRHVMGVYGPRMHDVDAAGWEAHETAVARWLDAQKAHSVIVRGGCYKALGSRAFARFWWQERGKRFRGEPHFQGVSWFGRLPPSARDREDGVDAVIRYCAYQTAPDRVAPLPPRPGQVPEAPEQKRAAAPENEGRSPRAFPQTSFKRTVVGADASAPSNPTPVITFMSRYTEETATHKESPFLFKEVFEGARQGTRGYCTADVATFTSVSNHNLCPSGERKNIAYKIAVKFFPLTSRKYQFRLGPSFSYGAAVFVDGEAEIAQPKNLWWKGSWESPDVVASRNRLMRRDKWHEVVFYGLSACCDGDMSIQFDDGHGWKPLTVSDLRDAQIRDWTPPAEVEDEDLGRGDGQHSYSIVESGNINLGSQQSGWDLDDRDGILAYRKRVNFGAFFQWTPAVQVYLRRLDASKDSNVRVFVRASNVDSTGFDVVVTKYGESRVFDTGVSWFAFDADPMYGTKFAHTCAKGSFLDNRSLPKLEEEATAAAAAAGSAAAEGSSAAAASAASAADLAAAEREHAERAAEQSNDDAAAAASEDVGGSGKIAEAERAAEEAAPKVPPPTNDLLLSGTPPFDSIEPQEWTLHEFSGFRKFEKAAPFPDPMPATPTHALTGFNLIDASRDAALLATVKLFNIEKRGVDVEFNTAGGSHVMALGACALAWTPVRRTIHSGQIALGSRVTTGWTLAQGEGLREYVAHVEFPTGFEEPPSVVTAISHINLATHANARFDVTIARVTRFGFEARIATWGDSSIIAITVSWMATQDGRVQGLAPDTPGAAVADKFARKAHADSVDAEAGHNDWDDTNEQEEDMDHDDDHRQ
jgi:hypothetical protein